MAKPGPDDDAIAELFHDHGQLSALVLAVRDALARVESGASTLTDALEELEDGAEALREGLLAHFGREEEAVFPFVDRRLPTLRSRIEGLIGDHDAVLSRAVELARAVAQARAGVGFALCVSSFGRFEERYAEHAKSEHAFLADVDAALDGAARESLREVLSET